MNRWQLLVGLWLMLVAASAQAPPLPLATLPGGVAPPFVALVREPAPKGSEQLATVWFVVPERQDAGRWRVLGESAWAATPLAGSPRLLRWRVNDRRVPERVLRLGDDGAVEDLLRGPRFEVLGAHAGKVFVQGIGSHVLDQREGAPRDLPLSLEVLATHGADWLVVVEGELARFDAAKEQVVRRYEGVAVAARSGEVEWDGGRFAVRRGGFVDEQQRPIEALTFGQPAFVHRVLTVWDLDSGAHREVFVRTQARGGSGRPVIPIEMQTELVGGLLRYTERRPAEGASRDLLELDWSRDIEWVTIDIATGEELLRRPYERRQLPPRELPPDQQVPDALLQRFAESPIRVWGLTQDLAWAFLTAHGVEVPLAAGSVARLDAACRSSDGQRLLVLHRGTFYLCDLAADTVTPWAAPAELAAAAAAKAVELCELPPR